MRESRLKRRNLYVRLFPENVGVKENRNILLCKTSGGETDARGGHGVRVGVECGAIGKVSSHRGRVMGPADLRRYERLLAEKRRELSSAPG